MSTFIFSRDTLIWLLLVGATLSTWLMGGDTRHIDHISFASRAAIVAIAAIKVRLVIYEFMHVRSMPSPWQWAFNGWIALVSLALLIGLNLASS
ncbi:cytochrome C oxidase subunit IV family protein [Spongiibacter taiwanensis]|uniref:cytochrome C oxidase subunit IV family protein n=1 Tax=Spongiibacter taiwanensis TaxID=1748242 RepID=UPI0020360D2C|nr:cytochrome C oxidase subunit IV family protein [Spongiibacter taiwanensis]USA42618.1 cytochrome C oxidase subunit IV family protein [Spongiibacter taiwanensis]